MGVIMYELFALISPKAEVSQRGSAFTSKLCFPLSPNGVVWESDGLPSTNGDLLDSIFDLIGTPSADELKFISDEYCLQYLAKFKPRKPRSLAKELDHISPDGI